MESIQSSCKERWILIQAGAMIRSRIQFPLVRMEEVEMDHQTLVEATELELLQRANEGDFESFQKLVGRLQSRVGFSVSQPIMH
jgi:hypothetical protein